MNADLFQASWDAISRGPRPEASRCRQLYQEWIDTTPALDEIDYVEEPPAGFEQVAPITRFHRMEHAVLGVREDVPSEEVELVRSRGWRFILKNEDFLEIVHLQAWYFQVRFFPRLQWIVLDAPPGAYFVIGDRPVLWGFEGMLTAKPSALRHPDVQLFAPLTRSLARFAYHPSGPPPRSISYGAVNRTVASLARAAALFASVVKHGATLSPSSGNLRT